MRAKDVARAGGVAVGPGVEPGVDGVSGFAVEVVADAIREDGQLIAPALNVFVACGGVGEVVREIEQGLVATRAQCDGDE